jgi:CHAT domain-containing protein
MYFVDWFVHSHKIVLLMTSNKSDEVWYFDSGLTVLEITDWRRHLTKPTPLNSDDLTPL